MGSHLQSIQGKGKVLSSPFYNLEDAFGKLV